MLAIARHARAGAGDAGHAVKQRLAAGRLVVGTVAVEHCGYVDHERRPVGGAPHRALHEDRHLAACHRAVRAVVTRRASGGDAVQSKLLDPVRELGPGARARYVQEDPGAGRRSPGREGGFGCDDGCWRGDGHERRRSSCPKDHGARYEHAGGDDANDETETVIHDVPSSEKSFYFKNIPRLGGVTTGWLRFFS